MQTVHWVQGFGCVPFHAPSVGHAPPSILVHGHARFTWPKDMRLAVGAHFDARSLIAL